MRTLFSKIMMGSMVAGAALAVSACGHNNSTNVAMTNMTDLNTMSSAGMTNDMSAMDQTGNMMMDNSAMTAGNDMGNAAMTNQM